MPLLAQPYEKQNWANQVVRPIALAMTIAMLSFMLVLVLFVEALLVGKGFGPALLLVTFVSGVKVVASRRTLTFRVRPWVFLPSGSVRVAWGVMLLAGVLFTMLWVLDFGSIFDWPLDWTKQDEVYRLWHVNDWLHGRMHHWSWVVLILALPVCLPAPILLVMDRFQAEIAYPNLRDSVRAAPGKLNDRGTGIVYDGDVVDEPTLEDRVSSEPLIGVVPHELFDD